MREVGVSSGRRKRIGESRRILGNLVFWASFRWSFSGLVACGVLKVELPVLHVTTTVAADSPSVVRYSRKELYIRISNT